MANIQNNKLKLEKHQQKAYENVERLFDENGRAAVIFPTGCGKSFVVLKYILEHPDDRILFLSPRNAIKEQMYEYIVRYIGGDFRPIEEIKAESGSVKQVAQQYIPNIECMLYQTIMGLGEKDSIDEVIEKLKPDLIVVDEMHHLKTRKAGIDSEDITDEIDDDIVNGKDIIDNEERINQENKWGQKFKQLLEMYPQAKLLGLSATPIRNDGTNVVEKLFEDAVAEELSLLEAIEAGIIYPPKYVVPDFIREDELESLLEKINSVEGERKEQLKAEYDELVKKSDRAKGIPELLKENITEKDGKYIIFCKDIKDMKEKMSKAKEWFGEIDNEPEIYGIHSKDSTSSQQLQAFNNTDSKHLKLMYCVGMIDEGVHLKSVSGVILAAKTGSRPTYLQRIGRTISSGKDKRQSLVIDLVNNNEILANEHNTQYGYEISDSEALEKLIEWIENKNSGKWPEYAEDKSAREKAMARRLARINNKYLTYVQNPDLLEELNEDSIDEIQEILQLGKTIGMFEDVITIDFANGSPNGADISIDKFLHGIEIKGVRRDFREILEHDYFDKNINMQNYEEYRAWCEEHDRLPRSKIIMNGTRVVVAKEGEKETEEQIEQRLGLTRMWFFRKNENTLSEQEKEIRRLYEELDEQYKAESAAMRNYKEYKAWCEEHDRLPRSKIIMNGTRVVVAKEGEKETEEQIEQRLGLARMWLFRKNENALTEQEKEIKRLYEKLTEQYKAESAAMRNYKEYKAWCEQHGRLPRLNISGVNAAKKGEKETEEQIEQRLGSARSGLFRKNENALTEQEKEIRMLYKELDEQYREESTTMRNYKEYEAWCEQHGKLPRTGISGVNATKKGEKETEEQIEQRLGSARMWFFSRNENTLTEQEKEIRRLYEELTEQYKEESTAMKNCKEYKAWCEQHGRLPRPYMEDVEEIEKRLGKSRLRFFAYIKKNSKKLTEEEQTIKELYKELDEQYREESPAMKNYKEYEAWCEQHGKLPRTGINGVNAAKKGKKETEEQIEQRLGLTRMWSFRKNENTLSEQEKEIRRLYEELDEQYKAESAAMRNYKEYKAWCEQHGKLPRQTVMVNGKPVISAKEGEKETEEQIEQRLGLARRSFNATIKKKTNLTEEQEELRQLYEGLDEQYGKKQPARNIAPTVKNVSISESKEAEEFIEIITNEKDKKGVSHNDE